jgi:hypothetical protein
MNNKITILRGEDSGDSFKDSLAEVIRLSGVDPEEVSSLTYDVLKESFDLPVDLIYQQLV